MAGTNVGSYPLKAQVLRNWCEQLQNINVALEGIPSEIAQLDKKVQS